MCCCQVVVAMIAPYRRVRTSHLAAQLNIPQGDVEQLLVSLILDERIRGRIDQVFYNTVHDRLVLAAGFLCHMSGIDQVLQQPDMLQVADVLNAGVKCKELSLMLGQVIDEPGWLK